MNHILISNCQVKKNKYLKANRNASRKSEHKIICVGFKTNIYKLMRLESQDLVDLTHNPNHKISQQIPENKTLILERIRNSEIRGLSGGGFPVYKKIEAVLEANKDKKYFIINGIECDPGLLHDEWIRRNKLDEVLFGIRAISKCVNFDRIILASRKMVEEMSKPITEKTKKTTEDFSLKSSQNQPQIEDVRLWNQYPLGEEHILIKKTLGINLKKKEIPAKKGILILNIQTVLAAAHAVADGSRITDRYLIAADLRSGTAKIVKAPLNMEADKVLELAMGKVDHEVSFAGQGLLSSHPISRNEKIDYCTNFLAYGEKIWFSDTEACKKCGRCTRKCVQKVQVSKIIGEFSNGNVTYKPQFGSDNCIGSNACTYYCKSGINTKDMVEKYNEKYKKYNKRYQEKR
ncbi:hypothetical protein [uncultured Robinsoniella sp.]|uniref:hypothetical protein n=1 Tax=uncultured Robinsoniella sp. TaxID=904190 RepID=UPI00374EE6C6